MSENKPPIPDTVIEPFLDKVATDELKVAVSGLFLTHPGQSFGGVSLLDSIKDHLDDRPFDISGEGLFRLCKRNLLEQNGGSGVVIKDGKGLRANPEHRLERMALAGFIGEWSLRWQDFSVQQAYGPKAGDPSLRRRITDEVYAAEMAGRPLFIPDLAKRLGGLDFHKVNGHVKKLVQFDILTKEITEPDYEVRITDPSHRRVSDGYSPETRAFRAAVERVGPGMTTILHLIETAKAIAPEIDTAALNLRIRRQLSSGGGLKGIDIVTDAEQSPITKGNIHFSAAARTPLHKLIEGVAALREGRDLGLYAGICSEIVNDKRSFSSLLQKSMAWSTNKGHEGIKKNVLAVMDNHPQAQAGLSVQDIQAILAKDDGKVVYQISSIRDVLNRLAEDGRLAKEERAKHAYTKESVFFFYPITTPETD